MKKFFKEFKQFISRGNIVDMAVGVIIGGAFSTIVTALTNKIFMPIVNLFVYLCTGGTGISLITVLNGEEYLLVDPVTGISSINPACIYIDWGTFIQAIINFIIIALVIFTMLKMIMKSKGFMKNLEEKAKKGKLTKEQKQECKQLGINVKNKEEVKKYLADKAEQEAKAKQEEEARKKAEEEANKKPTTEELLSDIKDLLAKQVK